jgi:hypothetical protein
MTLEEHDLLALEAAVEEAKMCYLHARSMRQPSTTQWNDYARLLHLLRLRRREMRDGDVTAG